MYTLGTYTPQRPRPPRRGCADTRSRDASFVVDVRDVRGDRARERVTHAPRCAASDDARGGDGDDDDATPRRGAWCGVVLTAVESGRATMMVDDDDAHVCAGSRAGSRVGDASVGRVACGRSRSGVVRAIARAHCGIFCLSGFESLKSIRLVERDDAAKLSLGMRNRAT